jgi:hypothetical protein
MNVAEGDPDQEPGRPFRVRRRLSQGGALSLSLSEGRNTAFVTLRVRVLMALA